MTTWIERWPAPPGDGPTVAVKDLIDVAGSVTTAGCRALADLGQAAPADAACITAVRSAGGRLVGKTNLHELAFGTSGVNPWFGTPPNPADPGRVPGGSSSGSAAAVALGEADVALGSDTGGSVRIPAACCGVVGLKTTHGLISLQGVWPLAPSYDTVGVLAADVDRAVLGMELLGVAMPPGAVPVQVGRARLPGVEIDPVIEEAVEAVLRRAELDLTDVLLPGWLEAYESQQRVLIEEAYQSDRHLLELEGGAGVSEEIRRRLDAGSGVTELEVDAGRELQELWTGALGEAVGRFGALVLPTLPVRPPAPEDFRSGFNVLVAPVNFAGFPAISLPVPVAEAGRPPCGLQIVGPPGSEAMLCALGGRIEAAA